ncbi:SDR family oxidoreductase [Chondrinema litorale]|uniref:SDR family oxidoreductase n=1 Tax=Chondrinema litorale TaxID=2994555 RepID=UPI0025438E91|nr:SDR family oxidoreductase [Chondrinema litorale]UZR96839.1 SDR family oxidoreductase [Chondrinema litorale]
MKVIIIGANGKVGKRVLKQMADSDNYEPTAFIRKEEQKAYFTSIQVPVIVASLESSEEIIAEAIKGFDAVVFCAGSGGSTGYDKTIEIDLYGAIKVINAATISGTDRFIMVGAAFSDQPSYWKDGMKPYYIAKHLADKELIRSGLNYTILRPVLLTEDAEAGKIMLQSDPNLLNDKISREAVAETIINILPNADTYGKILEMSEGPLEIERAVKQFV